MTEQIGSVETLADQPLRLECQQSEHMLQPPAQNRRFLYLGQSGLKLTPIDEATGITFPIISTRPLPRVGKSTDSNGVVIADWNHAYHPKERLIRGSPIELALRNSRVEWVHRNDHNSYHGEFFGHQVGDEEQVLRQVIFSAAGFIPDKGLQYDGREEAKFVNISRRTRKALWQNGRIKVAHGISIRDGLMDVALRKDFNGINESTIDEFLHTPDLERRFVLGSNLLSLALSDLTIPFRPLYKEMHERQQLRPDAPKNIGRFALKLVSQYKRTRALGILDGRLRTA